MPTIGAPSASRGRRARAVGNGPCVAASPTTCDRLNEREATASCRSSRTRCAARQQNRRALSAALDHVATSRIAPSFSRMTHIAPSASRDDLVADVSAQVRRRSARRPCGHRSAPVARPRSAAEVEQAGVRPVGTRPAGRRRCPGCALLARAEQRRTRTDAERRHMRRRRRVSDRTERSCSRSALEIEAALRALAAARRFRGPCA